MSEEISELYGYFLSLSFSVFIFIFYYYNYQEIVYPWKLIFVLFVHCKELKLKGFSFSFSQTRDWFAIHSSHLLVSN